MFSVKSVVIIGSGNVATHLGTAFLKKGIDIKGVFSTTLDHAQELAEKLKTKAFASITDIPKDADAYLLAISDWALSETVRQLPSVDGIVMHTSGSIGLGIFSGTIKRAAVFYPLQTFSKNKQVDLSLVPILIESDDTEIVESLKELGNKFSEHIKEVDSHQRKQLHLAAVFACNFSNYMYYIAQDLLQEKGLDFNLIKPLIKETAKKLDTLSPRAAQTGPAIRRDMKTLNRHLERLNKHPEYQEIYHLISEQIQNLKD